MEDRQLQTIVREIRDASDRAASGGKIFWNVMWAVAWGNLLSMVIAAAIGLALFVFAGTAVTNRVNAAAESARREIEAQDATLRAAKAEREAREKASPNAAPGELPRNPDGSIDWNAANKEPMP